MINWNAILRQSFMELFGLLGAVLIMMYFIHYAVHSPALENIIITVVEPLLAPSSSSAGGKRNQQQQQHHQSGLYQMILTPISILRHLSQKSVEDAGSMWLSVVILGVAFVGAAIDFVAGNFCSQLAVAIGVRLDAIEMMNPEWDVAGVATAGSRGSDGKNGNPPVVQFADENNSNTSNTPPQVPANQRLTADNNMGQYRSKGMDPGMKRR